MLDSLKEFVSLVIESKIREADVTDGKVAWGSDEHISDLEMRIVDLTSWRDRQRRGSEARANYSRLVSKLKSELASAKRHAARNRLKNDDSSLNEILESILFEKGIARAKRSGDAMDAYAVLNNYLKTEKKKIMHIEGRAVSGSQSADLEVVLADFDGKIDAKSTINSREKAIKNNDIFRIEVKSFGSIDYFVAEMTNLNSSVRKTVLKQGATIGSNQDIELQMKSKLPKAAYGWTRRALASREESTWEGTAVISGDVNPRELKVISGNPGDWSRLKARVLRGENFGSWRNIYTVNNPDLASAEKEQFTTYELAKAVQDDYSVKGDDILVLYAAGKIRCYSLTKRGKSSFGFPMFADTNSETIIPETAKSTSTGGGGRIGVGFKIKGGTVI